MNILVTLDSNYVPPLITMFKSLFLSNPGEQFDIYMMYSDIKDKEVAMINRFCEGHNSRLIPLFVSEDIFPSAPVFMHYTTEMYYRLLAYKFLPSTVEKILYLDPDILVINPIRQLYNMDIEKYFFAGAVHTGVSKIMDSLNRIRLKTYEAEGYYNSGVLLMNTRAHRLNINEEEIYEYVRTHKDELILPDQDILNGLYSDKILPFDDILYNYDARHYEPYMVMSLGRYDIDWVMENTAIIHFCGKNKPWKKSYDNRFGVLYKHYIELAKRDLAKFGFEQE